MKKNISINDVDCSAIFTRYGYSVSYKKIHGGAGGTMLDGSTTEDVITEFSTLSANILSSNSGNSYSPRLGISEDGKTAVAYTILNNVKGTKALDISSYTGEYYIGFFYAFNLYGTYNLSISTDLVQLIP